MITVILCHNKGLLIHDAVESILAQRMVDFEVIVASSEEDLTLPKEVRVLHIPGSPSRKRNLASRYAHGSILAFFDDDIHAEKHALWEMKRVLERGNTGMVFGKLLNMEYRDRFDEAGGFLTPTGFIWSRAESGIKDVGQYEKDEPIFAGKSAACMIKRRTLWKVGAFDERMGILGEESDLAWRVWLHGEKVFYSPRSVTYHAFNTRFKPLDFYTPERVYFNGCRNYITMLASNLEFPNASWVMLYQYFAWIVSAVGHAVMGNVVAARNIFRGLIYPFTHLDHLRAKRKLVAKIRKRSDAELFPIIMKTPKISYFFGRLRKYLQTGLHG